jgi:hypothetical protein
MLGHHRAHLGGLVGGGPDLERLDTGLELGDQRVGSFSPTGTATEIAMQRSPAEP